MLPKSLPTHTCIQVQLVLDPGAVCPGCCKAKGILPGAAVSHSREVTCSQMAALPSLIRRGARSGRRTHQLRPVPCKGIGKVVQCKGSACLQTCTAAGDRAEGREAAPCPPPTHLAVPAHCHVTIIPSLQQSTPVRVLRSGCGCSRALHVLPPAHWQPRFQRSAQGCHVVLFVHHRCMQFVKRMARQQQQQQQQERARNSAEASMTAACMPLAPHV